jgi:cytidylate kinase
MIPTLKLIEKQIAMSDIARRLNEKSDVLPPGRYVGANGVAFGPCILISRECGSGSSLMAEKIGKELGWNVFDSKMVDEIAKAARVQQTLVESVDERVHSHWEQTWRELLLDELSDKGYLHHLGQVVTALGHQGNVVMVGRGAQYLLPPQCALRVRLVASLDARIKRIAEQESLSPEEARIKIKQVDAKRAAFLWRVFRKDAGIPLHYDLMLNTGDISIASAARIALVALEEKLGVSVQKQPGILKELHERTAA